MDGPYKSAHRVAVAASSFCGSARTEGSCPRNDPMEFPYQFAYVWFDTCIGSRQLRLLEAFGNGGEDSATLGEVWADLLPRYVDPEAIAVVTGGVAESTELLKLRWDHIQFTGNGVVGRVVMRAAAEHLTPVTLELGGKNPTVILPGANLAQAARRIAACANVNAGQLCVSPDFALVHKDVEVAFIKELKQAMSSFYGDDARTSSSFARIVNKSHFHRLKRLLDSSGGEIVAQHGKLDEAERFFPPTVVKGASLDAPIMQEEIFGPVFPIMTIGSLDEAVTHINKNDKPLALYVFGSKADADKIIAETSSGTVCVNDAIFQMMEVKLPFGGVGESGMGCSHGKWGFDEFSHRRAVMYRATWIDPAQRYPPYSDTNLKMFEKVMIGPLIPEGCGLRAAAGMVLGSARALTKRIMT